MTDYLKFLDQRGDSALNPAPREVADELAARPGNGRKPARSPSLVYLEAENQVRKLRMVGGCPLFSGCWTVSPCPRCLTASA